MLRAQSQRSGAQRRTEVGVRRRFLGVLPIVWNRAGGQGLLRGTRRSWPGETERGCQALDFRVKQFSKLAKFPRPEDSLRAMVERAPQADALAASWIEHVRPLWTRV